MLNRSLRLAHTALALFAALLGFLFLHSFESYMPVGPDWYVDVVRPAQDKAPFSEINARIEAYARARRLDVAKLVPDRKDPKGVEHLYVLAASGGSFAQSWMERGYGAFNAEISYKVHPRSEASALEPAGTYLLSGSREDLRGFRETLAGYGYNVDSYTETMTLRSLPWLFGGYALFGTAAVITLLIVALTGVGVAMNARAYGVQRLQGMTLRQAWALDARASLTFLSKAVGVLAVPLLAALYLYNSLHQLTAFLLLFAALGALGVLLTLCVHGVSLWILWHSSILDAIKGSGASRWTTASAYMVRGTAILVAAILGGIVVNDALTRTKAQDIGGQWETARDLGEIRLNVGLDSDDSSGSADSAGPTRRADSPDERIAAWERSLNRRGLLMVSIVNPGQEQFSVPAGAPIDSLYANQSYLDRQRVKDVVGRPVTAPTGSDEAVVAIPQRYRPHTAQILKQAVEMLRFTGGASQSRGGNGPEPRVRAVYTPDERRLFTYRVLDASASPAFLDDPVIVALSNDTALITTSDYVAYTTQRHILATDHRKASAEVRADPQLSRDVFGINSAAYEPFRNLAEASRNFVTSIVNCAIALVVLLITTAGFAVAHTRRNGQLIFASRISGWTYWNMFGKLLILDCSLTVAVVSLSAWLQAVMFNGQIASENARAELQSVLVRTIPPISASVLAVALAIMAAGLIRCSRRIVTARSIDVG